MVSSGGRDALESWFGRHERGGLGAACRRKAEHEGAALAEFAGLEGERAAVSLRELAADEEAEPGAGLRAEARIVDPEEALEDLVLLVARDADAAVLDDQRRAALGRNSEPDPRPSGAI